MGNNFYMYIIGKELVDEIKSMSSEELGQRFKGNFIRNLPKKELWNFGNLHDASERIYAKGIPLFEKEEVMEEFSDEFPCVIGKDGLLEAIHIYREKIIAFYNDLIIHDNNPDRKEKQERHIRRIFTEWVQGWALDLDEGNEQLTTSWQYEYAVFELTRLLKTIDFNKDTILVYNG